MSLKLDRNVLQWFDYVFENEKTSLRHYNFNCTLKEISSTSLNKVAFILEKNNSKYWKLYFEIPAEVTLKLKQNIHPYLGNIYTNKYHCITIIKFTIL